MYLLFTPHCTSYQGTCTPHPWIPGAWTVDARLAGRPVCMESTTGLQLQKSFVSCLGTSCFRVVLDVCRTRCRGRSGESSFRLYTSIAHVHPPTLYLYMWYEHSQGICLGRTKLGKEITLPEPSAGRAKGCCTRNTPDSHRHL